MITRKKENREQGFKCRLMPGLHRHLARVLTAVTDFLKKILIKKNNIFYYLFLYDVGMCWHVHLALTLKSLEQGPAVIEIWKLRKQ